MKVDSPSCLGGTEREYSLSWEKINTMTRFFFSSINWISAANTVTQFESLARFTNKTKETKQSQLHNHKQVCGLIWEQVHDPPFPIFSLPQTELTEI